MAIYFISDLHLSSHTPEIFGALQRFLSSLLPGDQLYILGDFFDAWIGDDDDDPFSLSVNSTLASLTDRGVSGFILTGNRDFLLGSDFCQHTGFSLLPEEHVVTLNGERVLLMHGDSLCTDDSAYIQFRNMVRQPQWQDHVLSLPLVNRRIMAGQLREQSKSLNAIKAEDIMDVNQAEVEARLLKWGVKKLIHGHTHRPARHDFKVDNSDCERWVLGDWDSDLWYLRVTDKFDLVNTPITRKDSIPQT